MASRRRKHRTHVKVNEAEQANVPKSFVIKNKDVTKLVAQLVLDLRKVMEPNTASRLQERRKNKLKDYVGMAGPLGVSHLMILSQTETSTNIRFGKFPQGPTCFFQILKYSLIKDITALQKKPKALTSEYLSAPLVVLNNMPVGTSHGKLLCTMFQNMFPSINTSKVKLTDIRRVVLFHYDAEKETVEFRHFMINVKMVGVSKSVKRILRSEIQDLSNFADAAEFVLKAEANMSESEVEPDSVVTLGQNYVGAGNVKSSQRSINLVEVGPRMSMKLVKITEGLNGGKILYHAPHQTPSVENSDEELEY